MDVRVIEGMMERIAPLIKQYTEGTTQRALEPVKQSIGEVALRVSALEEIGHIKGDQGEQGEPGTSVTIDDVAPLIKDAVVGAVAALPVPKDGAPGEKGEPGESFTILDVKPLIDAEVERMVSAIPAPKDGAPGEPGKSVTIGEVEPVIRDLVTKVAASLPTPKDGVPGRDGIDGKDGAPGRDGQPGPSGDIAFAPPDLAQRVASAVRLLAESPAPSVAAVVSPPITIDLKGININREFKFERDANNRIVRAVEEAPP